MTRNIQKRDLFYVLTCFHACLTKMFKIDDKTFGMVYEYIMHHLMLPFFSDNVGEDLI